MAITLKPVNPLTQGAFRDPFKYIVLSFLPQQDVKTNVRIVSKEAYDCAMEFLYNTFINNNLQSPFIKNLWPKISPFHQVPEILHRMHQITYGRLACLQTLSGHTNIVS